MLCLAYRKETDIMKNIILKRFNYLFLLFVLLTPTSCGNHRESKHKPADTKTTYWLYDELSNREIQKMKKFTYFYGSFYVYLDPLYKASKDENNNYILPKNFVCYGIECSDATNYKNIISQVFINDPSITIFSLNILSSEEDVTRELTAQGFTLECAYCSGISPHWTNEYMSIFMPPYGAFSKAMDIYAKKKHLADI